MDRNKKTVLALGAIAASVAVHSVLEHLGNRFAATVAAKVEVPEFDDLTLAKLTASELDKQANDLADQLAETEDAFAKVTAEVERLTKVKRQREAAEARAAEEADTRRKAIRASASVSNDFEINPHLIPQQRDGEQDA